GLDLDQQLRHGERGDDQVGAGGIRAGGEIALAGGDDSGAKARVGDEDGEFDDVVHAAAAGFDDGAQVLERLLGLGGDVVLTDQPACRVDCHLAGDEYGRTA